MSEFKDEKREEALRAMQLRSQFVTKLKENDILHEPAVENAFLAVPRELFVPGIAATQGLEAVYQNDPLLTKVRGAQTISTSTQPSLMAEMLQFLKPLPGQKILEIGSGTGYNAALLAHLVGPKGQVVSVELEADLVEQAKKNLQTLGLDDRVQVVAADGWKAYAPFAPYDGIIVTAHSDDIAPTWIEQLKIGGRLVLPLFLSPEIGTPAVVAFRHEGETLESFNITDALFLSMQGEHKVQNGSMWDNSSAVVIRDEDNKHILVEMGSHSWLHIDVERKAGLLAAWLSGGEVVQLDEEIPSYANFAWYMDLRYGKNNLFQIRMFYEKGRLGSNRKAGIGFVELENDPLSLALLIKPDNVENQKSSSSVLLCGPNAKVPLSTLLSVIKEWKELGAVGTQDLHIRVHKGNITPDLDQDSWSVPLRSVTLVLRYIPSSPN